MDRREARNSVVRFAYMSGEEAIQRLTDMFGADGVSNIAREHEQKAESDRPMEWWARRKQGQYHVLEEA